MPLVRVGRRFLLANDLCIFSFACYLISSVFLISVFDRQVVYNSHKPLVISENLPIFLNPSSSSYFFFREGSVGNASFTSMTHSFSHTNTGTALQFDLKCKSHSTHNIFLPVFWTDPVHYWLVTSSLPLPSSDIPIPLTYRQQERVSLPLSFVSAEDRRFLQSSLDVF